MRTGRRLQSPIAKGEYQMKFVVRAVDEDFVEVEHFDTFEEALKYAEHMETIFGSWNVEMYTE